MKKILNSNIKLTYFLLVAFLPLSWITLADIGTLSIKPVHLTILPLLFCLFFKSYRKTIIDFARNNKYLVSFFLLLMIMNFISMALNTEVPFPEKSASYIYKNLSYFAFFLFFGGMIILYVDLPGFHKNLTLSNTFSILLFTTVATISFGVHGSNFLADMVKFFLNGDINGMRRDLYRTLFNTGNTGDEDLQVSLINSLMGSFIFIHFTSLYAYHHSKKGFYSLINIVNLLFSFFFIIAAISRSNIIALAFGYVIYWGCDIIFNNNKKRILQLISVAAVITALILVFWTQIETALSDTSDMYSARFGNFDENARWGLNSEAINSFTENSFNFLIGKGSGAKLNGKAVHNFIIGSAYQAGILGFILSILFYGSLWLALFKYAPVLSRNKYAFIISALMSIPLIRQMESGDAGSLTFQEWFCVAFFLGFVIARKKQVDFEETYRNTLS